MPRATISLADDPSSIARCHAVMRELRPHLADEAAFVAQVRRQQAQGYRLACLEEAGEVRAAAGYRFIIGEASRCFSMRWRQMRSLEAGKFRRLTGVTPVVCARMRAAALAGGAGAAPNRSWGSRIDC